MRALRDRIRAAARLAGADQRIVERDYAQSYVLLGLADSRILRDSLVFKGGTALKKVYFGDYRFSEDLDFTSTGGPAGPELDAAVLPAIARAQAAAREIAPVALTVERYRERDPHPGGQDAFIVRVQFPWHRQPMVPVKIEITHDEPVLMAAEARTILHGYDERLDGAIRTYCLEEIAAEKIRATRQTLQKLVDRPWARPRARDFFDLWHLVRLPVDRVDWSAVAGILPEKCRHRGVRLDSVQDIFDDRLLAEVRASWARTLGPFVPDLPDVELVIRDLRDRLGTVLGL